MKESVLSRLTPDDFPTDPLSLIAEKFGPEKAVHFFRTFEAQRLYIPRVPRKDLQTMTAHGLPNEDMRIVAEKCGTDVAVFLIKKFAGQRRYIPRYDNDERRYLASKCFDGINSKRIACALGISHASSYRYLKHTLHS